MMRKAAHGGITVCSGFISHNGNPARCMELAWTRACGENVAWNSGFPGGLLGGAVEAMLAWEHSPTHFDNIVNPAFTRAGVGYFTCQDNGRTLYYFTGMFGRE